LPNILKKAIADLKKRKYHIICSWILLTCFVAGQYMVYAHQHNVGQATIKNYSGPKNTSGQTVSEKCQLCDVMHHNTMVVASHVYNSPAATVTPVFYVFVYNFTSIQLILSCGRAPPCAMYS